MIQNWLTLGVYILATRVGADFERARLNKGTWPQNGQSWYIDLGIDLGHSISPCISVLVPVISWSRRGR